VRQPIIFIGMHRSGTSLLGRLLERLGLFVGVWKDENNEAVFFKQLNHWLMVQCGANWDMPQPVRYLWENEESFAWVERYIRDILNTPRVLLFLGLRRYLTTGGIAGLTIPWGWKDPRNTFILPLWLHIFPEAKIIYVERHGVDVAQSLLVRCQKQLTLSMDNYRKHWLVFPYRLEKVGFIGSPRCTTLEGGFSLWKEYVNQAQEAIRQIPNCRVLKLRYEQILEDPIPQLRACAEFCGLTISKQKLKALTKGINGSRAYAYLKNPVLRDFARVHESVLANRGYTA